MKLVKSLLVAGLSVSLLTGCALNKTAIITVNGEPITKAQYEEVLKRQTQNPQFQQLGPEAKDPNGFMMLMAKDRITNELIVKALLEQQIKEHKITVSEDDIKAKRKEITDKLGSEERLQEVLKQSNVTESQLRDDLINEIKVDKLVTATSDVKVSDKDVADFYNKNKASFNRPETVKASHILIEANPDKIKQDIINHGFWGKISAKSPRAVAVASLKAVKKNKKTKVVGFWNKVIKFFTDLAPLSLQLRFIKKRWGKSEKDAF